MILGMPAFTIVYATYRPGGIDILAHSLKDQLPLYELVVVDRWLGRCERGEAARYLRKFNIPVSYYGPPVIPEVDVPYKVGQARAWNVGALYARTDHVIFIQDFCWLPPGFVVAWMQALTNCVGNVSLTGSASLCRAEPPKHDGDISIWETDNPFWNIYEEIELWEPTHHELFNTYFPIHFLEDCNGFDERGAASDMGMALLSQMAYFGIWPEVRKSLRIGMVDHRVWGGSLWNTNEELKHESRARIPLHAQSPNPYSFKDVRDTLLSKEWQGCTGL